MVQRIELIGVDDQPSSDESDDGVSSGALPWTEVHQDSVRRGGSGRLAGAGAVVLLLAGLALLRSPAPTGTADAVRQPAAPVEQSTTSVPTPPPALRRAVPSPTRSVEPVILDASGITLVVGRGIEKTFIALDTGASMVVDIDGELVAGTNGYVALSVGAEETTGELCWFSLAERSCEDQPTAPADATLGEGLVEDASVHVFDQQAVRSLTATSHDGRWSAGWRFGQLTVTDESTGDVVVVPDIALSYFDDSLVLVG